MTGRGEHPASDRAKKGGRDAARERRIRERLLRDSETRSGKDVSAVRASAGLLSSTRRARRASQRLEVPSRGCPVGRARLHSSGGARQSRDAQQLGDPVSCRPS
jgi:hypothetical protein